MPTTATIRPQVAPALAGASEAELAERAVAGDGAAFAALYDRHEQEVFNFCYRLTGAADDAADATQEAFVAVLERLPKLESRELNFGAYLMTTARHSCYRLMERQGRAEPTDEIPEAAPLVGGGGGGGLGMPDPGDPGEDPERAALLKAQQEEVRAANARLPERQREVLALRELQEQRDSSNDQVNTQTGGGGSQGGALPGSGTIPPATGIPPATDSPPPPASTPPPSAPPPSTPPPPRTPPPGGGRAPGGP